MIERLSSAVAFACILGTGAAQVQTFDRTYDLWNAGKDERGVAIKPFIEQGHLIFATVSLQSEGWYQVPYITLIGPNGDRTWDRVFEPEGPYNSMMFSSGISVDHRPDLGYVACGWASDTVGRNHGMVLRLNAYGQEEWRVVLNADSYYSPLYQARFTDDGGIFAKGHKYYGGVMRSVMLRLAPDGSEIWNRFIGPSGNGSWCGAFELLDDGGFVVVGQQGQEDQNVPWMGRYTDGGDLLWERTYEVEDPDVSYSQIKRFGNERYAILGRNTIPFAEHVDQYKDVFAMVDSVGSPIWTTTIGDYSRHIGCVGFEVVADQGILGYGYGNAALTSFGNYICGYLLALDQNGDSITSQNVSHVMGPDSVTVFARVLGALVDEANGRVLFVGGTIGPVPLGWTTQEDTWVFGVDLSTCPMLECSEFEDIEQLVGVPEYAANSMVLFPNPVHSGENMNLVLPDDFPTSTRLRRVSIIGSDGRTLRVMPIDQGSKRTLTFVLDDLAPGAYSVKAEFLYRAPIIQKVLVL